MNEIERAIAYFNGYGSPFDNLVIEALQEKQEREEACCENCKYLAYSQDADVHWCRVSQGLDGDRKLTDFCSYFEKKQEETKCLK